MVLYGCYGAPGCRTTSRFTTRLLTADDDVDRVLARRSNQILAERRGGQGPRAILPTARPLLHALGDGQSTLSRLLPLQLSAPRSISAYF